MTCLQLCVLFNFQICRTLPRVFVNILLKVEANPVQNAFSELLISGHSEFETGLLNKIRKKKKKKKNSNNYNLMTVVT